MDGRNSSGRRISLLNDEPAQHSTSYSSSSYSSTPCLSPQTPQLVRSSSADSSSTMQSPSPVTPSFSSFDGQTPAALFSESSALAKDPLSAYPPVSHAAGPLPYPAAPAASQSYFRRNSSPEQQAAAAASANPKSKKNSYPCPLAKQYGCSDYFTTSGHAARHAKKHTGKKDAFCPECNKAFTRKDNMEQHRRTHQSGRNSGKLCVEKKAKHHQQQQHHQLHHQVVRRPKPAPLQPPTVAAGLVDPSLPLSPMGSFAVQPADSFGSAYPDPTQFAHPHLAGRSYSAASASFALDALAIAASGEKRKYSGCT